MLILINTYIGRYSITITLPVKIAICIITFICFILYAPADTVKRPLTNKRKRILRKIATCIIAVIYSVIIVIFNNNDISIYLLSGMIIETNLILPITYRIYGMPYRNYLMV